MSSIPDAETLLAVDVGSINTRANLFDIVDGRYRLVASARAASTAGPPLYDIREGVRQAFDQVHAITGRRMIDEAESLILPSAGYGSGVDVFVATTSAGPNVRTALAGLMPSVSLASARRLAASASLQVVCEISLSDRRRREEQIDQILAARPDLVLIVGGTDGGAASALMQVVDVVGLAMGLIPEPVRPRVVYAGNRHLGASVVDRLGDRAHVTLAPNVRPDLEEEDAAPTRHRLAETLADIRSAQIVGLQELRQWSGGHLLPTPDAFGRIIRYLSRIHDPDKGILGVDLGASRTTIAAAFEGELYLSVASDLGLGAPLPSLLEHCALSKITRWLPIEVRESRLRDYMYNKSLRPGTVPALLEELHIEYALARQLIRSALFDARVGWPAGKDSKSSLLMPPLEPVIAGGGVLARAPRPGYATLALLDALQPTGITTLILDPHSLTPSVGAAAGPLPMAAVHVLESGGLVRLATVVSPVGRGRIGQTVLQYRLEREAGKSEEGEVRYGQLMCLPLSSTEKGRLILRPEHGYDVGFGGPGKAGALREVTGGAVGLVIDARGRPLELPKDESSRRELNQKWLWDLGAVE